MHPRDLEKELASRAEREALVRRRTLPEPDLSQRIAELEIRISRLEAKLAD